MSQYRTHIANDFDASIVGEIVTISGWVHRRRDHGGVIFIDLRDRSGLIQVVFDPTLDKKAHSIADEVRPEYVLMVTGKVRMRPDDMINKNLASGEVEIEAHTIEILNRAKTPPFEIDQEKNVSEELRLKYRYLDLRHERLQKNIMLRHEIIKKIRDYHDKKGFLEIETPILIKGTPEGSREYIVPSRVNQEEFYVLPQSPQQLKQLLMLAGMEKYFQIARCFRDEDLRGDRQPEFTQLDVEMSFVDQEDVMNVTEELLLKLTKELKPEKKILSEPFTRLTWQEAMDTYGSDKPDLRFGLEFVDLTDKFKNSKFNVFKSASKKGVVRAICAKGMAKVPRRELDELEDVAKRYGARGLAYIVFKKDGLQSPIVKFLSDEELDMIAKETGAETGDIVFFGAGDFHVVSESLGAVRLELGKKLDLIDEDVFAYAWVYDFPLFETSKETEAIGSVHHPFTAPHPDDIDMLKTDPLAVRALCYDFILNGNEIGGGSIRIHSSELQNTIFETLQMTPEDIRERFGHMVDAFTYGAPPHGGIAWGLDRLVMLFAEEPNIREVIAFPKNQSAQDLMLGAPSTLPTEQLREAHIKIIPKTKEESQ